MYIIILGPPGAGKGTQSLKIAERLAITHLSTGEILRKAAEEGSELGLKAKEVMSRGELVSDEVMIGIIREQLAKDYMKKGFILDGFPRTLNQAIELDKILDEMGFREIKVINITVPEDELVRRMLGRGRSDDTEETVRNRLKVYYDQTMPVQDYYSARTRIYNIEGVGSVDYINDLIIKAIHTVQP